MGIKIGPENCRQNNWTTRIVSYMNFGKKINMRDSGSGDDKIVSNRRKTTVRNKKFDVFWITF